MSTYSTKFAEFVRVHEVRCMPNAIWQFTQPEANNSPMTNAIVGRLIGAR